MVGNTDQSPLSALDEDLRLTKTSPDKSNAVVADRRLTWNVSPRALVRFLLEGGTKVFTAADADICSLLFC